MLNRPGTYSFAGKEYDNIPDLLKALIKNNDPLSSVSHLGDKRIKIALLDEWAKSPFEYGCSSGFNNANALSRLMRTQRRTGLLYDETRSFRELSLHLESIMSIGSTAPDLHDYRVKFETEAAYPLDPVLSEQASVHVNGLRKYLFYLRALRYMEAGRYARAIYDLRYAESQYGEFKLELEVTDRISHLLQECYYKLGYYQACANLSNHLHQLERLNDPGQKIYAVASALRCQSIVKIKFDPVRLLCEALVDQRIYREDMADVRECIKLLFQDKNARVALKAYDDEYNPGYFYDLTIFLHALNIKKHIFDNEAYKTICSDLFHEQFAVVDQLETLITQYPASAYLHTLYAASKKKNGKRDEVLEYYNIAIRLNPCYHVPLIGCLPLMDLKNNPEAAHWQIETYRYLLISGALQIEHLNKDNIKGLIDTPLGEAILTRCLIDKEDGKDVRQHFPLINDILTLSYKKNKDPRRLIYLFAVADPTMAIYPTLRDAIKQQFNPGDPQFVFFVKLILNDTLSLTDQQKMTNLLLAIQLCAANDKRRNIESCLLSDERVVKLFKGETVFQGIDAPRPEQLLAYFRDAKCQDFINSKINPPSEPEPSPGFLSRFFGGSSSQKKMAPVDQGQSPNPKK